MMNYPLNIQRELITAEHTYQVASATVKSKQMKEFFSQLARSKQRFRKQFSVKSEPDDTKVKISFESSSIEKILVRCLNEEEKLIKEYQKAIYTSSVERKYYAMVSHQLNSALQVFNQLRAKKLSESYNQ